MSGWVGWRQYQLNRRQTELSDEQTGLARRQLALEEARDERDQQRAEQAAADAERANRPALAVYWEGSAGGGDDGLGFKATVINEGGSFARRVMVEVRQGGQTVGRGGPKDIPAGEKDYVAITVPRPAVDAVGGVDGFLGNMTLYAVDSQGNEAHWLAK